jgi:hypothetical protein
VADDRANSTLNYAAPPSPTDASVSREDGAVRIDLGPMSTPLFLAAVLPWAILVGLGLGVTAWWLLESRDWVYLAPAGVPLISAASTLAVLSRHRHQPRVVGVADGQVFYADERTKGSPTGVRPAEVTALRVYRSWWRPWLFHLATVPPPKYMGVSATNPVVLLIGFDRRSLERIRRELAVALGLEAPA